MSIPNCERVKQNDKTESFIIGNYWENMCGTNKSVDVMLRLIQMRRLILHVCIW